MNKKGVVGYLVACLVLISSNLAAQEQFYIWFERSGGFAGISTSIEIDTKALSSEEAEELRQLIDSSGFFKEHKSDSTSVGLPDQFQYKISIEWEGKKQSLEFGETAIPEGIRPLFDYLTQKARSQRKD